MSQSRFSLGLNFDQSRFSLWLTSDQSRFVHTREKRDWSKVSPREKRDWSKLSPREKRDWLMWAYFGLTLAQSVECSSMREVAGSMHASSIYAFNCNNFT